MGPTFEIGPVELTLIEAIGALTVAVTKIRDTLRIMTASGYAEGREELQKQHKQLAEALISLREVRAQMEVQRKAS